MSAPKLWWSPTAAAMSGKHGIVDRDAVCWRVDWNGPALDDLPSDAVRLAPLPVIRYSELRKRIESTRHGYWHKGGQVNTSELTDQILSFLHDAGVAVRSDQYVAGPARPRGTVAATAPVPGNTQET